MISCVRGRRIPKLSHVLKKCVQPESNRHTLHGKQGGYHYIMDAMLFVHQVVNEQPIALRWMTSSSVQVVRRQIIVGVDFVRFRRHRRFPDRR